jgi:hypothetical protein
MTEISASSWFCYKEICHDARSHVTMHGHMNLKSWSVIQKGRKNLEYVDMEFRHVFLSLWYKL